MIEFVPLSDQGRRYEYDVAVRLSDADPRGLLRLDGVARYLQDAATEDWEDTGIAGEETWVVRRTTIRRVHDHWPSINERLRVITWCGGAGAAWAERRTNIVRGDDTLLESAAIWVPVDRSGHPRRVRPEFFEVYGEAMRGRKVSGRVTLVAPPEDARRREWPLRRADLDVVGHVNNAAIWQVVSEVLDVPVGFVDVVHHGAVEGGHDVELVTSDSRLWLFVDGQTRVSAHYQI